MIKFLNFLKEWILSDEEKLSLRNKIHENRKKRQTTGKVSKVADSTTSSYNFPNVVQLIQNSYGINSNDRVCDTGCYSRDPSDPFSPIGPISSSVAHTTNDSSIHSSSSSNGGHIKVQTTDSYRPNCDSLSITPVLDEHCFLTGPKAHFMPMEVMIHSDRSDSSEVFSNKCQVITNGSIESIKNSCIETLTSFGSGIRTNAIEPTDSQTVDKADEIPDNVYQKTIELEFASIPIKEMFNNMSTEEFNRYESQRLEELSKATEDLNWYRNLRNSFNFTAELNQLLDAAKLMAAKCDNAIRKLVIMSKRITAFKNLCQHDQIALMKASCFEILIQRSVISYNLESEYWPIIVDVRFNYIPEAF